MSLASLLALAQNGFPSSSPSPEYTMENHTTHHYYAVLDNGTNDTAPPAYDNTQLQEIFRFQYYAWGVVGNIIAALGLLGNVLSIFVLANRRMRSSTSCYLIALAIFDSIVLISLVLFLALPTVYTMTGQLQAYYLAYPYMHPYAYPVALTAQTCSIYTTVAFTVERFIAVCRPLMAANMCTMSRARKSLLIIVICSLLYNIPRMLEFRTVLVFEPTTNTTSASFIPTSLGSNQTFRKVYFIYMHIFIMLLIPFTTLAVLNTMLIRAVKQSEKAKGKVNSKTKKENSLTIMLIAVIIVFLICQVLSIADNIFSATLNAQVLATLPFIKVTCISSLMVITNSAVNFYLYCVFGRKFRKVFYKIFFFYKICDKSRHFRERETSMMNASSFRGSHRPQLKGKLTLSVYENGKTKSFCTSNGHTKYTKVIDQSQV